jgi:parallel beta-helix repeat protein
MEKMSFYRNRRIISGIFLILGLMLLSIFFGVRIIGSELKSKEIPSFSARRAINAEYTHPLSEYQTALESSEEIILEVTSAQYVNHNPININGNDDFISQATTEGWPGDGTLSTPYIIEKLIITGSSGINSINIRDTDVYFRIQHCTLSGGEIGISLTKVNNGYIYNNTVSNNQVGIILWDSSTNNVIINNTACYNIDAEGIGLHACDNNTIIGNVAYKNNAGILLWDSSINNVIINNSAYSNNIEGIGLHAVDYNIIKGNHAYDNLAGVLIWEFSNYNRILFNTLSFNTLGIIIKSNSNRLIGNSIYYSDEVDLEIEQGYSNNSIIVNNFITDDLQQIYDRGFDNDFKNNYWLNWIAPDTNDDGIVDLPFPINGGANNQDQFPRTSLSNQISFHNFFIPTIIYPKGGETINGISTIQWVPSNDTLNHPISYSVYYSSDSGTSWIRLAQGLTTPNYAWNTSAVNDGTTYLIRVVVTCSKGLTMVNLSEGTFAIKNTVNFIELLFPILFLTVIVVLMVYVLLVRPYQQRSKTTTDPHSIEMPSRIVEPEIQDVPLNIYSDRFNQINDRVVQQDYQIYPPKSQPRGFLTIVSAIIRVIFILGIIAVILYLILSDSLILSF